MRFLFDLSHFSFVKIIVFGSCLLGLYYFTLYNDGSELRQSINKVENDISAVDKQLSAKQKELDDTRTFERETQFAENVVSGLLNFIPSSLTFTDISYLLIQEAKSAGVNIEVKRDELATKRQERKTLSYHTLRIRLTVSGSFSQILLFLSKLTDQKHLLVVKNINMKMQRQEQLMEADLLIESYRYEEAKAEEGK